MEPLITLNNNNKYNTIQKEKSPLNGNQKNIIPQHSVFNLSAKRLTVELAKKIHKQLVNAAQYQHSHNKLQSL